MLGDATRDIDGSMPSIAIANFSHRDKVCIGAQLTCGFKVCLCAFAREIGFSDDSVKNFVFKADHFAVAPCRSSQNSSSRDDQFEIPSAKALSYMDQSNGGGVRVTMFKFIGT